MCFYKILYTKKLQNRLKCRKYSGGLLFYCIFLWRNYFVCREWFERIGKIQKKNNNDYSEKTNGGHAKKRFKKYNFSEIDSGITFVLELCIIFVVAIRFKFI